MDPRLRHAPSRWGDPLAVVARGAVRGGVRRRLGRALRRRRLQRTRRQRRPAVAAGARHPRLLAIPASDRLDIQPAVPGGGGRRQRGDHPAAAAPLRDPIHARQRRPSRRACGTDRRGDRDGPRRGEEPRPGPHPAQLPGHDPGDPAHQLLPGRRRRCRPFVHCLQVRPAGDPGPPAAAPVLRDLGVLAARRGRAPALRLGRPRWSALERSAGGLPHRDPRPGQGAGGQERGDRAGRGEGRVLREEPPRPVGRPRCLAHRGQGRLPRVHRVDARHHGQPRGRRGRPARRRRPPRRRRPLPRRRRGQGHGDLLRPRQLDRRRVRLLARATRSRPAGRSATTTRPWASPPAGPGSRSSGTSASSASTPRPRTSPSPVSGT